MGVNGAKSARHVGCPGILTDCRERPAQGLSGSCHPGNHVRPAVHICPQLPCENRGQRSKKCAPRRLSRDPNRLSGTPSARPGRQLPPWQPTSGLLYISAPSSPAKIGVNGAKSARHVGCPGILTGCRERLAQGLSWQLPPWQPRQACCTYLPPAPLRKWGSTEQKVRAT